MPVAEDPEGISARAIQDFVDLKDKRILEIGCGKGRLTFPLAEVASHITAIDPLAGDIETAIEVTPDKLKGKIDFSAAGIKEFALPPGSPQFDIGLFTWSL